MWFWFVTWTTFPQYRSTNPCCWKHDKSAQESRDPTSNQNMSRPL